METLQKPKRLTGEESEQVKLEEARASMTALQFMEEYMCEFPAGSTVPGTTSKEKSSMRAWECLKIRCLGIALLVLSSTNVKADEAYKYLNATCISEVGFFEISASTIMNIGSNRDFSRHGLYPEGQGSITCHIPQTVLVEYRSPK